MYCSQNINVIHMFGIQVYRIFGQTVMFYPTDSLVDFYTSYDVMTLIDTFKVILLSCKYVHMLRNLLILLCV